ncbi:hypothetical protein [Pontibacillus marinus]|uniref:IDEAL domain-containing protein n=1 Tax=Pontibacillus marinus BH030004 = DSM 16465 TaxID=1385511 RepID=A0A0A5FVU8_9BACI|nr:hypothetical protein [Pontibacillus marinus]KGX84921.1 hypothetical protein N783_15545 [Pontibacillus marinus BH030004 = DSM 16465]
MKKAKVSFRLNWFPSDESVIHAKRELPYEIKLASTLVLDELCYNWNKSNLEKQVNEAIDYGDYEQFEKASQMYKPYTFE